MAEIGEPARTDRPLKVPAPPRRQPLREPSPPVRKPEKVPVPT